MMRPSHEEALSYLTGLAPVGEPFEVPLEWIMTDLGLRTRASWHARLNGLIRQGCVKRIACGAGYLTGVLVVTKALEPGRTKDRAEPSKATPGGTPKREAHKRQLTPMHVASNLRIHQEALALIERIPPDTRSLTARLMGDPLPGRGALAKVTRALEPGRCA